MSKPNSFDSAKLAITAIFNSLCIDQAVFVDDELNGEIDLESLLVELKELDADELKIALPELRNIPGDIDILGEEIRQILFHEISQERIIELNNQLSNWNQQATNSSFNNNNFFSFLDELLPNDKILKLTPPEWERRKAELIEQSQQKKILFLFDRDLSRMGGEINSGLKIISSLLSMCNEVVDNLICCLLTHTVTPETQEPMRVQLSEEYSIPRDRFALISKLHLSEDPLHFAQSLKYAALSTDFARFKGKAKSIISEAVEKAASQVDKVDILDLEQMVLHASSEEGLWEPDMLFRLHSLFHRLEARRLSHLDSDLEEIAQKLRLVSEIPSRHLYPAIQKTAWELQHQELYESSDFINRCHLPIELGDIFEKTTGDSEKYFILLAQPCDLMVRKKGKRTPDFPFFPLVEIVKVDPSKSKPDLSEEIPFFNLNPNEKWIVKYKRFYPVHSCILDFCVFNADGNSKLSLDSTVVPAMRPSWKNRFEVLSEQAKSIIKKVALFEPNRDDGHDLKEFKKKAQGEIRNLFFQDQVFKPKLENNNSVISFNCRRVKRLCRSRAMGLLLSYTSSLGRIAHDRDLVNSRNFSD